jgi:hypothetical protein
MLSEAIASANLAQSLRKRSDFHPFPNYDDRAEWEALPLNARAIVKAAAAAYEGRPIPELRATQYMEYWREGNRKRYEDQYFARRSMLIARALGVCLDEGDDKAVDELIDTIWAICEESTWVLPAHNTRPEEGGYGKELADVEAPIYVDLFSAETASALSWTLYLAGSRIARESPLTARRIEVEVKKRVLDPYLKYDYYGWMGLSHNDPVNNWNPWINANVLACALLIEPDETARIRLVEKACKSADRFIAFYAEDGGCDEGPSYFNAAGAALLDLLSLLDDATDGAAAVWDKPLIRSMSEYIAHAHLANGWFLNFADASAKVTPSVAMLGRLSKKMGSERLAAFARYMTKAGLGEGSYTPGHNMIYRQLCDLFRAEEYAGSAPCVAARDHYFPGIQVFIARQAENDTDGLIVAGKGGTNDESHNHNDIGNYVVYLDGEPRVADVGVETYSRKTFSPDRYDIWTMQSGNHNTAIINGQDQLPGPGYGARSVQYDVIGDVTVFSLDIAGAYGTDAKVESYRRTITYDRKANTIEAADRLKLTAALQPTAIPLILAVKPDLERGKIIVPGKRKLVIEYDADLFNASLSETPIPDARLQLSWKRPSLFRALLTRKDTVEEDEFSIRFRSE